MLMALFIGGPSCTAQDDPEAQQNLTMTLHVYANLIQIPVLILGPSLDGVPPFNPKDLVVSVDNGKPFRPVHVHPQGDDPIALAILLDVSDTQNGLLPDFGSALAKLASRSLRAQDRVAVYALDCELVQVSGFATPDPRLLKLTGEWASKDTTPRTNKHRRNCGDALRIHDALADLADRLWEQQGRRVILAISHGVDNGSTATGEDVHQVATGRGVAIFGLSPMSPQQNYIPSSRGRTMDLPSSLPPPAQSFEFLCEETGGLARSMQDGTLRTALQSFVRTVRERTIIEFPRPKDTTAGSHIINVMLPNMQAFIRSAGVTVPLPDSRTLADPNTIHPEHSAPAEAPPTGVPSPQQ